MRGRVGVAELLLVLLLGPLSALAALTPAVSAQSGQWVITTSIQAGLNVGVATVTVSGSGSAHLMVDGQGQITGTGTFQGSITVTASAGCSGGGTFQFSESETYSGRVVDRGTGNATLTVASSGGTAPTAVSVTCPNPNPPPATTTQSVPVPSQMATASGSFSILLVNGYTYRQSFPPPVTGQYALSIAGGATTSTTTSSQESGSMSLAVPYGEVQLCDSGGNDCRTAGGGEMLQPGQCIVTGARSGVVARSSSMEIAVGENSGFCLPPTREGISSLCTQAQVYATIQGQLHVGTFGQSLGQNVYIRTLSTGVCDTGTEFAVQASGTGTTVMVIDHAVMVTDLTSNSTVTIGGGKMIAVQSSPSGMGQMEMQQAVQSFDIGSIDRWWLAQGGQTATTGTPFEVPDEVYIALGSAFVIAFGAIMVGRSRSRGRPPPPPS